MRLGMRLSMLQELKTRRPKGSRKKEKKKGDLIPPVVAGRLFLE
jgi:hypothetical protein